MMRPPLSLLQDEETKCLHYLLTQLPFQALHHSCFPSLGTPNQLSILVVFWHPKLPPAFEVSALTLLKLKPACQNSCRKEWINVVSFFFGEGSPVYQLASP